MMQIVAIINSTGVMKHCEKYDHDAIGSRIFRQVQPVLQYPAPVRCAVDAMPIDMRIIGDDAQDLSQVDRNDDIQYRMLFCHVV